MAKHGLFLGGVPTEPDVKRLLDAYPNLKAGHEVAHKEIEQLLGVEAGTSRYQTVTSAWRRHILKVGNLKLVSIVGIGFRALDGMERVTDDIKRYSRGAKQIRRAADDVRRVEIAKLSSEDQRATEHVIRHMEATADHLRKTSKEIAIEFKPQAQLPRSRLVR